MTPDAGAVPSKSGAPLSARADEDRAPFATLGEIISAARDALDGQSWDFFVGGSETETTVRRNRSALDSLAFRPRILRSVEARSCAAEFLGHQLAMPVMIAPIGAISDADPMGAIAVARAAAAAGTVAFISINSSPALDVVRAAAPDAALVFQAYVFGDAALRKVAIERAEAAGCLALCLTVDSHVYGRRERDLRRRHVARQRAHPNFSGLAWPDEARAAATWDDLARTREETALPLILKGVQTAEDAEMAIEHGVDVVYVSNHGGRQLDHCLGAAEVLPEVVSAIDGRVPVLMDGGIRHGTDVIKGIALGADGVLVGRLSAWGLAAGGEQALVRALAILRNEIETSLGLLGVAAINQLERDHLMATTPLYDGRETL